MAKMAYANGERGGARGRTSILLRKVVCATDKQAANGGDEDDWVRGRGDSAATSQERGGFSALSCVGRAQGSAKVFEAGWCRGGKGSAPAILAEVPESRAAWSPGRSTAAQRTRPTMQASRIPRVAPP
jgi:hypothetical protein